MSAPERPRLHLLMTESRLAGAERVVQRLALGARDRWEVRVGALRDQDSAPGEVGLALRDAGIPFTGFGLPDPRGIPRLWRWLREPRPQVLAAHLFHASWTAHRLGPRGVPVVSTWHLAPPRHPGWRQRATRWLLRADAASIAVSKDVADWIAALGGGPATVVPNGLAPGFFKAPWTRDEAREELGLPAQGPLVGFVGRLHPQKGVDLLLDAWPEVMGAVPGARLALAGRGSEEAALRQRAAPIGDGVHWLGFQEDPRLVYAAADLVVVPSRYEGFGLVATEALAAGRVVVLTRVPGLDREHGEGACFVPPEDPPALGHAIVNLLRDPEELARRASAARAGARKLSEDAMIVGHEAVWRGALNPPPTAI